jgi:guanosine-3',5'-bis(diphosphate) 3'-pyrophosphohydrolase
MTPGESTRASIAIPELEAVPEYVLAMERSASYLDEGQRRLLRRAWAVGAVAHEGQLRKSGEPYITHPVAVAQVLAEQKVDAETLVAAILHDTLEDTRLTHEALVEQFGETVAELVDGVTKLDKLHFRDREQAAAESFRKMLLAMARDLRVILIKLADRLHNMRTLGSMPADARRRIAAETLEIYAPIAQRLGMNLIKAELQDLGFKALHPMRHRVLRQRIRSEPLVRPPVPVIAIGNALNAVASVGETTVCINSHEVVIAKSCEWVVFWNTCIRTPSGGATQHNKPYAVLKLIEHNASNFIYIYCSGSTCYWVD